ncbi:hypothetical protein BJX99DRAFT_250709 [Aspergillus californicus]
MANVALVTGGASGMGLAVCRLLANDGWHVAIADRAQDGARVAAELKGMFIEVEVSDYQSVFNAFSAVWERYGRLNFVFANAGVMEGSSFYSLSPDNAGGLDSTININLTGVIFTSHVALHFFRKGQTSGPKSLIMTSSAGGLYPVRSAPIYAASKHGILGFMRSIASRLYTQDGISVNCINPGATQTGIISPEGWDAFPPDCISTPDQIADVVKSVIEDGSRYGQAVEIVVDRTFLREPPPFLDERVERLTLCTDSLLE